MKTGKKSEKTEKKPKEPRKPKAEKKPKEPKKPKIGKKLKEPAAAAEKKRRPFSLDSVLKSKKAPEATMSGASFSAGTMSPPSDDGFVAGVRSADPVLIVDDDAVKSSWKRDLVPNISGAVLVVAFLSLFCMVTDSYELIPFALPGALVFGGLTTAESLKPGRLKWIIALVAAVLLAAAAVIFRGYILGGIAELINQFYDVAEEEQAYIYTRFPESDNANATLAAVWISCLTGLLAALPPVQARRGTLIAVTIIMMLAFAYYGLLPSWICIAVLLAALLAGVSRGNVLSALPVVLSVLLIFGVIVLIDPGESYTISRIDENFRDKFALNSLLIQNDTDTTDDYSGLEDLGRQEDSQKEDSADKTIVTYTGIAIAVLIIAALGAAAYLFWKRIDRRRKELRAGIDSSDPREAVTAMFPYSVRWLKAGGVETGSDPFFRMTASVASQYNQDYADRFSRMYLLWREAAYSDHTIAEEDKDDMDKFLKDTVEMVKDKLTFSERVTTLVKYAL